LANVSTPGILVAVAIGKTVKYLFLAWATAHYPGASSATTEDGCQTPIRQRRHYAPAHPPSSSSAPSAHRRASKPMASACLLVHPEDLRMNVTGNRQMVAGRCKVLTNGEHFDIVGTQVVQNFEDLVVGFTETDHQPRLGRNLRIACLEAFMKASECA
jgi:hypothetical protein